MTDFRCNSEGEIPLALPLPEAKLPQPSPFQLMYFCSGLLMYFHSGVDTSARPKAKGLLMRTDTGRKFRS